ncbi:hypothetical protein [Variovorax sp. DXTD-1]|uniref:hypothetical protein n=1 Tax=Variovorax sp. DXTD-1 TaxID=2495592 RepID=UPI000F870DE1|nr:hypothetical protein [Variovorax sp. DXTD-1]RST54099.1 hypothetical protein EJI00_02945 [Variovorax sp. DXTD-1]
MNGCCPPDILDIGEPELVIDEQVIVVIDSVEQPADVLETAADEIVTVDGDDTTIVTREPEITLLDVGTQGPPGPPGEMGAAVVEFPAAVPLGGNRVVRVLGGEAVYADHTTVADANLVLGITRGAVVTGALAQIQTSGLMTESSWAWTPDLPVFVGPVGTLTQTSPLAGFNLIVGIATGPTQIFIGARMPIVLQE